MASLSVSSEGVVSPTSSSSSSPPASTFSEALSYQEKKLEAIAHQILAEMNSKITASQRIIPRWEIVNLSSADVASYCQKFAHQFLKYLHYQITIEGVRNLVRLATSSLKDLKYPTAAGSMAVSEFGVGEEQEMAAYAGFKCHLQGLETLFLTIGDSEEMIAGSSLHTFILIDVTSEEIVDLSKKYNDNFIEILNNLKHGILLDPFLNLACSLKEFKDKGKDLLLYASVRQMKWLLHMKVSEEGSVQGQVKKESLLIYHTAKTMLLTQRHLQRDLKLRANPLLREMEKQTIKLLEAQPI